MKKIITMAIGLVLACVHLSACDAFYNGNGNGGGGGGISSESAETSSDSTQEPLVKGGLTQEQWTAAFQTTFALDNFSLDYEYAYKNEDMAWETLGGGTICLADGRIYYFWQSGEKTEYHIAKQGNTIYEWMGTGSAWEKYPSDIVRDDFATGRGILDSFPYLDFTDYASWFASAEYNESTGQFSFAAQTRNEKYPCAAQVVIRDGRVYSVEYEYIDLATDTNPVYSDKYVFKDIGTTAVGELPNV